MNKSGLILAAVVILAAAGGGYYLYNQNNAVMNLSETYQTQYVGFGVVDKKVSGAGKVEVRDKANIYLNISQTVASVYVKEGDWVSKGDILVDYDMKRDYADLLRKLNEAEIQLKNAELNLLSISQSADGNELVQYYSDVTSAQKNITDAESDLVTTQQNITNAEADMVQARQNIADAEADLVQARQYIADAESDVVQARQYITDTESDLLIAQKNITDAETELNSVTIKITQQQLLLDDAISVMEDTEILYMIDAVPAKTYDSAVLAYKSALETLNDLLLQKENRENTLETRRSQLGYAENRLETRRAQLGYAENRLETRRAQLGYAENRLETRRAQLVYAENRLETRHTQLDFAENRLETRHTQFDYSQQKLENSQNKLADESTRTQYEIQQNIISLNQITIEQIKADIDKLIEISASPVDGSVTQVNAVAGGIISKGVPVVTISDTSSVIVKYEISEYDAPLIELGQKAYITTSAMPDKLYLGAVVKIAAEAVEKEDSSNNEVKVPLEISIDNLDEKLKIGYSVDVDIITGETEKVLNVPISAVFTEDGRRYAYLIKDNTLIKTEVTAGFYGDKSVEIISGINEGDLIVLDPKNIN